MEIVLAYHLLIGIFMVSSLALAFFAALDKAYAFTFIFSLASFFVLLLMLIVGILFSVSFFYLILLVYLLIVHLYLIRRFKKKNDAKDKVIKGTRGLIVKIKWTDRISKRSLIFFYVWFFFLYLVLRHLSGLRDHSFTCGYLIIVLFFSSFLVRLFFEQRYNKVCYVQYPLGNEKRAIRAVKISLHNTLNRHHKVVRRFKNDRNGYYAILDNGIRVKIIPFSPHFMTEKFMISVEPIKKKYIDNRKEVEELVTKSLERCMV